MKHPHRRKADVSVSGDFCRRFGSIAVHKGYATGDQIKAALTEQVDDNLEGREHRLLGSILFEQGWITEQQIEQILVALRDELSTAVSRQPRAVRTK